MAPPLLNSNGVPGRGLLASFSRVWNRTYASDYIGLALMLTGYLLIQFLVEPFHRMFSLNDLRISFPHAEVERVPLSHAFGYALFLPLAVLALTNLFSRASAHKHHVSVLGLLIALLLASLLTDIIKNAVGRPRPDLLARCIPRPPTPDEIASPPRLVTIAVCTQTDHHTLHDGWRSFPSGHSSFAFAGLGYLSLFLAAQMRIFTYNKHTHTHNDDDTPLTPRTGTGTSLTARQTAAHLVRGDLLRTLFCLTPLLGATMIAISRCQDYRHDVYDVCVGSLLGWTVGYWSYRRYWPRLGSARCDEPYDGPLAMVDPDEEEEEDEEEDMGGGGGVGGGRGRYGRVRHRERDEEEGGVGVGGVRGGEEEVDVELGGVGYR